MSIERPFWHPAESAGFILDWDGVLAETKLDFSGIRERYYGGRKAMLLEEAGALSPSDRKSLMKDLRDIEMHGAEKAAPVPGAKELLKWLDGKKIPYCIVSRNCAESIELAAQTAGIKLPKTVFNRDNSKFMKPDPRAFLLAAEAIGAPACECVAIGDFLYDVQCARRAGVRAVLVQREMPEWNVWTDASYPKLTDLVAGLDDPTPLVPWEYHEVHSKRGDKWLNGAYRLTIELPDSTSPTLDSWLSRAAALAIGAIMISPDAIFSPSDWKNSSSFGISAMGRPVCEIAEEYLAARYPMTKIVTEASDPIKAPKNSLDIMRFLERKIFAKI
ncbi:MAG: HAD family phosphatase [Synergistaceae bacterium]|nr:HAD family phosphatase [Synergistaceae bacterium]